MIQELLGGLVERKVSIPNGLLGVDGSSTTSSSSLSSTNISAPSSSASSSPSSASETQQNLRCPRCDSSNTKFCYYNNYNLTQPRHFCKTCRRYWTKGGALRNVPIGGGCRKAKPTGIPVATSTGGKSGGGKAKPPSPDLPILGKPSLGGVLDHELPSSPVLWASPHTSQLLALLRATSIPNPNPNPSPSPITSLNSVRVKEDEATIVSHMVAEPMAALNAQNLSLDPLGQLTIGPCGSLWRNGSQNLYQQQAQLQPQQQQQNMLGEAPSSGIQELYQRLRSSTSYYNDPLQMVATNMGSSASNASTVTAAATMPSGTSTTAMEPIHLNGGEFGYWNPAFLWTDLPTANGAFP